MGIPYLAEADLVMTGPHDRHAHAEIQILWVIEGELGMEIGEKHLQINPGYGIVLLPGCVHRVTLPTPDVKFAQAQIIDLRLTDDPSSSFVRFVRTLTPDRVAGGRVKLVADGANQLRCAVAISGPGRTARILSSVWGLLAELAAESSLIAEPGGADRRVLVAERYMTDHLSDPIHVDQIADASGLSRSQLTRLLVDRHGVGPAHLLRRMRVNRAQVLLETSTLAIKEIARVCGFLSHHHFSRVFQIETGRRPSLIRRG